jgi:hypothetical protein
VATHTRISGNRVELRENVRYCNDNLKCEHEAKFHSIEELSLKRQNTSLLKRLKNANLLTGGVILVFVLVTLAERLT